MDGWCERYNIRCRIPSGTRTSLLLSTIDFQIRCPRWSRWDSDIWRTTWSVPICRKCLMLDLPRVQFPFPLFWVKLLCGYNPIVRCRHHYSPPRKHVRRIDCESALQQKAWNPPRVVFRPLHWSVDEELYPRLIALICFVDYAEHKVWYSQSPSCQFACTFCDVQDPTQQFTTGLYGKSYFFHKRLRSNVAQTMATHSHSAICNLGFASGWDLEQ